MPAARVRRRAPRIRSWISRQTAAFGEYGVATGDGARPDSAIACRAASRHPSGGRYGEQRSAMENRPASQEAARRSEGLAGSSAGGGAIGDHFAAEGRRARGHRSEEHTSELQSLMRISYAVFCLKKQ